MMHLVSASIGNQLETGKTWSPGTEGGDQYQQETDVRTKERGKKVNDRQQKAVRKDFVKKVNKKKTNTKELKNMQAEI